MTRTAPPPGPLLRAQYGDKDFIPWDDDIDLAVHPDDWDA